VSLLRSKPIKYALYGLLAVFAFILIVEIVDEVRRSTLENKWRSELISSLTSIQSYDEAVDSISHLGVVLGDAEGSWVVIDYKDTHNEWIVSTAVARTKDGQFFQSPKHFCGRFSGFQSTRDSAAEAKKWLAEETDLKNIEFYQEILSIADEDLSSNSSGLLAIDKETDPDRQRELLIELGFEPIESP
jgi:hypothetical protein